MANEVISSINSMASLVSSASSSKIDTKLASKTQKLAYAASVISETLAALESKLDGNSLPESKINVFSNLSATVTNSTISKNEENREPQISSKESFSQANNNLHSKNSDDGVTTYLQSRQFSPDDNANKPVPVIKSNFSIVQSSNACPVQTRNERKNKNVIVQESTSSTLNSKNVQNEETIRQLNTKIENLQDELKDAKNKLESDGTLDFLRTQVHDLNLENSRQKMEMHSLRQQNNLLRAENRRMVEIEDSEKKRIASSNNRNVLEWHVNLVMKETVLAQIEELYRQQNGKKSSLTLHSLRTTVSHISNNNSPNLYDSLLECISQLLKELYIFYCEHSDLETRIFNISKESDKLRSETSDKISKIQKEYQDKCLRTQSELDRCLALVKVKDDELNAIVQDRYKLLEGMEDLKKENENLQKYLSNPIPNKLIMAPPIPGKDQQQSSMIDRLSNQNSKLQDVVEKLELSLEEMDKANFDLKSNVFSIEKKYNHLETKVINLKKQNSEYQVEIEHQKSQIQKGELLINSLRDELKGSKPNTDAEINAIKHLDLAIEQEIQNVNDYSNNPIARQFTEKSLPNLIPPDQEQLRQFEIIIQDHLEMKQQLEDENKVLLSELKKSKQKFKARENAWIDKIKSARNDYETLLNDYSVLERLMDIYSEQYRSICQFNEGEQTIFNHPFPFSDISINLSKRASELSGKTSAFEEQIRTLKSNFDSQSRKLDQITESNSKFSNDQIQTKESLYTHNEEIRKLREQIKVLEADLAKKDLKIRKIIGAYQQMIQ